VTIFAASLRRVVVASPPKWAVVAGFSLLVGCGGGSPAPSARPSVTVTPSPTATPTATAVTTGAGPHSRVVVKAQVGGSPCGVAGTAGAIWVSDAAGARLLRLDPATGKVVGRTPLDDSPCAITVAYGSLWIVTQSGVLDRVDPRTGRVIATIRVGSTSYQAVATPAAIWVSNRNDGTLNRIDPGTNRVTQTLPTPGVQPGGMVYANGSLWVGDDSDGSRQILRIDVRTHATTRITAGQRPAYLAAAAGAVFVSDVGAGTVTKLDSKTGRVLAVIPAGVSPVNLAVRPGARPEVWVPDDTGGHVVRIDARTGKVVETIDVPGEGPALVTAAAGDVWVTMFSAGEVWRIHPSTR
jgi:DNA-binding beta-propeller fold protein YncE